MSKAGTMLTPPARQLIEDKGYFTAFTDGFKLVSAWSIVDEVAPTYRYRRSIVAAVKHDLVRFAALRVQPLIVGIRCSGTDRRPTTFYFDKSLVDKWLDSGGRSWIIAELERRSAGKVIAFPGRRARQ
jgi:hypothetical protein